MNLCAALLLVATANEITVEERIGTQLPIDLQLRDEHGAARSLGTILQGRTTLLLLAYPRCPALCGLVQRRLTEVLRRSRRQLGRDYRLANLSYDPRTTPVEARQAQTQALVQIGRPDAADSWPFLLGDAHAITTLSDRLGIRYVRDARSGEVAHPAVLVALSPGGTILRYLYGTEFSLTEVEGALDGQPNSLRDRLLLVCGRLAPTLRRYAVWLDRSLRFTGIVTLLLLLFGIALAVRRAPR